jgi:hypothetical protein
MTPARRIVPGLLISAAAMISTTVTGCDQAGHPAARTRAIRNCPTSEAVPGYGNHHSYPQWDPTSPPAGRIVRCFASLTRATAMGYPAAAPRGTLIVDGVFLEPTGPVTRRQCRAAARKLGYAVPCPGIAPAASSPTPSCSDGGGCVWGRWWFAFEEYGFNAPPRYRGISGRPAGHFLVLASRLGPTENSEVLCGSVVGMTTIEGTRATITDCTSPGSTVSGHVILRWVHRAVLVAVTFHGFTATNLSLATAVARHIAWVGARR